MSQIECTCICKCLGLFKFDDWPREALPKNVKITILYREPIKVFFKNSDEARAMNYTDYDQNREKDGYIYAFTGLRGDAKQLYHDIKI